MDWLEITKLVIEIGAEVGKFLLEAFQNGDTSVLDKPLKDIIPAELRTTLAKKLADAAAAKKFGTP